TIGKALAFLFKGKEGSVIGEKYVARQFFKNGECFFEIVGNTGIAFFSDELIIESGRAAGKNHIVRFCSIGNFGRPRRIAFGVAGSQPGSELSAAELNRLAVANDLVHLDRREREPFAETK